MPAQLNTKKIKMRFVIEIILLIIIFYCTWDGFRRGAVNAGISLLALVISLAGAILLSGEMSGGAAYIIRPFVSGYIDSQYEEKVLDNMGIEGLGADEAIAAEPELMGEYANECMLAFGFDKARAAHLSPRAAEIYSAGDMTPTAAVSQAICGAVAFAACMILMFILIMLFISFIKQFFDLSFRIQDNADVDLYGGAALGFAQGFIYCVFLCWLLSFCGIIIGMTTLSDGLFSRFFLMLGSVIDTAI